MNINGSKSQELDDDLDDPVLIRDSLLVLSLLFLFISFYFGSYFLFLKFCAFLG